MCRLGQNNGRRQLRRDPRDGREAHMDDPAWGTGIEAGATTYELLDDVQVQRSPLGTVGRARCVRELEVWQPHPTLIRPQFTHHCPRSDPRLKRDCPAIL